MSGEFDGYNHQEQSTRHPFMLHQPSTRRLGILNRAGERASILVRGCACAWSHVRARAIIKNGRRVRRCTQPSRTQDLLSLQRIAWIESWPTAASCDSIKKREKTECICMRSEQLNTMQASQLPRTQIKEQSSTTTVFFSVRWTGSHTI
jgi:hypothetical protein